MNKIKITAFVVGLMGVCSNALATTEKTTFKSTATLSPSCVLSANDMKFGAVSLATGAQVSGAIVTFLCSNGFPATLGFSSANGSGDPTSSHYMKGVAHGDLLQYDFMYGPPGRQLPLHNGTLGITGSGVPYSLNTTLRITPNQNVAPDDYSDTVTATVTY